METPDTIKILKRYPKADAYLKYTKCITFGTEDDRLQEIETSSTMIVDISDKEYPDYETTTEIFDYCQRLGEHFGIQEFRLEIYDPKKEGDEKITFVMDRDGYIIRVTARCGQKILLAFENYDDFKLLYPMMILSGSIDKAYKKKVSKERVILYTFDNPPPVDGYRNKIIKKSDILNN